MKNSKCKIIEKFLKGFDQFGTVINFNFENERNYKSFAGGVLYFLYLTFAIYFSLYNFIKFATRDDFNLVYNEGMKTEAPKVNLTENQIKLAFSIQTDNDIPILTYLDIGLNMVQLVKNNNGKIQKIKTSIKLLPCTPSYFYDLLNESFIALDLKNKLCPDDKNLVVKGLYTENDYIYLEYSITINPNYYKETPLLRQIFSENDLRSQIFITGHSLEVYNYTNPIGYYLDSYQNYLDFNSMKRMNLNIEQTSFITDGNILFSDEPLQLMYKTVSEDSFITDIGEDRLIKRPKNFDVISKMYIRSSSINTTIKRVYTKLPQFLADLSGILSLFTIMIWFLVTYINEFKMQQSLIRKIFKFHNEVAYENEEILNYMKEKFKNIKEDNFSTATITSRNLRKSLAIIDKPNRREFLITSSSILKKNETTIEFSDIKTNNKIENKESNEFLENFGKENLKTNGIPKKVTIAINPQDVKRKMKVRFNFCEIVMKLTCCCFLNEKLNIKDILIEKAAEKMNYNMNILTYIRKMQEIDIIKYMLLNKDQISILNFLSKPSISIVNESSDYSIIDNFPDKFNKEEVDNVIKAFLNLNSEINYSEIDKKLLPLFRKEIENLIL